MNERYLEVTFRNGRPFAAYYHLPRRPGERSVRSACVEPGLVVDFAHDGRPIGIEITAPSMVNARIMNRVLRGFGLKPLQRSELDPLKAA